MLIEIDRFSREELLESLDRHMRLYDVAYRALQCIAAPGNDRDLRQDAANALARLNRYPDDSEFTSGSIPAQ